MIINFVVYPYNNMKHKNKGAYIRLVFLPVDSIRAAPINTENLQDMPLLRLNAFKGALQPFLAFTR